MKQLAIIALLGATLSGCATYYPAPANYGTRAYSQPDANGWQVVSVTPVAPGTGAAASQSRAIQRALVSCRVSCPQHQSAKSAARTPLTRNLS